MGSYSVRYEYGEWILVKDGMSRARVYRAEDAYKISDTLNQQEDEDDGHFITGYHDLVRKTTGTIIGTDNSIIAGALGVAGESGEFADSVKKLFFHAHPMDREHMIEELGDIIWYVTLSALNLNTGLNEVMQRNMDKLNKRYPSGFDSERSKNRG